MRDAANVRFILDASVTITWAMADETHPVADRAFNELRTGAAIVPEIWWYEVRNILVVNERRGRIQSSAVDRFIKDLQDLRIEIDRHHGSSAVLDMARTQRITVYDAAYLSLAVRERLPLATLDKNLRRAASAVHIALLD